MRTPQAAQTHTGFEHCTRGCSVLAHTPPAKALQESTALCIKAFSRLPTCKCLKASSKYRSEQADLHTAAFPAGNGDSPGAFAAQYLGDGRGALRQPSSLRFTFASVFLAATNYICNFRAGAQIGCF